MGAIAMSDLPPGFVIVQPQTDAGLPPGFELEQQAGGSATATSTAAPEQNKAFTSTVLPLTKDVQGNVHFDAHAGVLGAILSGLSLPHDVYQGTASPNDTARVMDLATLATPLSPAARVSAGWAAVPISPTPGQAAAAAAGRIGVDLPKAAASDSTMVQRIGQAASNVPIGGSSLRTASEQAVIQTGDAASRAAAAPAGATVGAEQAGAAARAALENYVGPITTGRAKALYDKVDNLVDNTVLTPLDNTQKVVANIMAQRGDAALPPGDVVNRLKEAITRPGGLNYQGIKKLRTDIGEDVDKGLLPSGMSGSELKQVYGALSADLGEAVKSAGGPDAQAAFARANNYYQQVSARRENLMRLLNAKSDEGLFSRITQLAGSGASADAKLLAQARKSIPADEWASVTSAVISRLGRSNAASTSLPVAGMQPSDFSPALFASHYAALSDKGKNILFNSVPNGTQLRGSLDDIATVSQRLKSWQRFSNPSGTAQNMVGGAQLAAMGGATVAALHGDISAPLAVIGSMVGPAVVAHALARPATAKAISKWSRAYEGAILRPGTASFSSLSTATQNMAGVLSSELGVKIDAQKLIGASQPDQGGGGGGGGF